MTYQTVEGVLETALYAWANEPGNEWGDALIPPNANITLKGTTVPPDGATALPVLARFSAALVPVGPQSFDGGKRTYVGSLAFVVGVMPDTGAGRIKALASALEDLFPVNARIGPPENPVLITGPAEISGGSVVNGRYTATIYIPVLSGFYK